MILFSYRPNIEMLLGREMVSENLSVKRGREIPRVDNVKVSKKETDMENGGISISLLVLGIIVHTRAAGIGSCLHMHDFFCSLCLSNKCNLAAIGIR